MVLLPLIHGNYFLSCLNKMNFGLLQRNQIFKIQNPVFGVRCVQASATGKTVNLKTENCMLYSTLPVDALR